MSLLFAFFLYHQMNHSRPAGRCLISRLEQYVMNQGGEG